MRKQSLWISLCVLCVSAVDVFSAAPRDELLKLVPADAGFVVVVQDLRGHLGKLRDGPFAKKFVETAQGKSLLSESVAKEIAKADADLAKEIGVPWAKLRDDLIGDAVVFIYRPGPVEQPEAEEGVALMWAREPATAEVVMKQMDDLEKKSGRLKSITDLQHAGQSYRKRVRSDEPDEFQYRRGNLVAIGSGEKLIKQIIDADQAKSSAEPEMAKRLQELKIASAGAVWWLNPRAFDAHMAAKQKEAKGAEAVALAAFAKHWQALDGVALFLDPNAEVKLGLAISARPDALPPATRKFLSELSKPSALLSSFPEDALLTIAGRFAVPSMLEMGASFLPDATKTELRTAAQRTVGAALGMDVLSGLPQQLGPDWGLCVTASPLGEEKMPRVTAAVRLDETNPPTTSRVIDGVHALATLAAVGYNVRNPHPISPRMEQQGNVEVRYFVNDAAFPTGLKPAFAWKEGFLVIASSPDAIRKFTPPVNLSPAGSDAPLLRLALRGWTNYLRDRKADAAKFLAGKDSINVEEATRHLDEALKFFDLFDGLDVSLRSESNRATLTLRLRTSVPVE